MIGCRSLLSAGYSHDDHQAISQIPYSWLTCLLESSILARRQQMVLVFPENGFAVGRI